MTSEYTSADFRTRLKKIGCEGTEKESRMLQALPLHEQATITGAWAAKFAKTYPVMADWVATEVMPSIFFIPQIIASGGKYRTVTRVTFRHPWTREYVNLEIPGLWYPDGMLFIDIIAILAEESQI